MLATGCQNLGRLNRKLSEVLIAECSFCNTFDLHQAIIGLENPTFGLFESGRFTQILLYLSNSSMDTLMMMKL